MVTDSGTRFWDAAVKVPLEQLEMKPATHALLEKTMFFAPLPFVTRVVFIATPHRGSFQVTTFILSLVRRLVTLPVTVVEGSLKWRRAIPMRSPSRLVVVSRLPSTTCALGIASSRRWRRARSPQGSSPTPSSRCGGRAPSPPATMGW